MIKTARHIASYISEKVHNPYSTLSNLAFVALGWQLMYVHELFALIMIGVGIGSTGFHCHRNDCWHKADIVMIYYMLAVLSVWLWFGNLGICIGLVLGMIAHLSFTDYSRYSWQIIGSLGAIALLALFIYSTWSDIYPILIWFGLAFATSLTATYFEPDEDGPIYDTFHAIWHIFSAIGIYEIVLAGVKILNSNLTI